MPKFFRRLNDLMATVTGITILSGIASRIKKWLIDTQYSSSPSIVPIKWSI